MSEERLSATTYAIFAALVEDRIGLHYRPEERQLFASKLAQRREASGFATPLDYYYFLRYDDPGGAEWARLAEALLVGETYFFREAQALEAAIDVAIVPATKAGARARVLSAGCATGEEPLSLAMLLRARGLAGAVEIVAVDVNPTSIERARAGVYRERSLRALPETYASAFKPLERGSACPYPGAAGLAPTQSSAVQIDPTIVAAVDWRVANLLERAKISALGPFDLVLCRNVLIYFRDENVVEIAKTLAGTLRPSGRLLVGASESLLRYGTGLRCEERCGAFFYGRSA